MLYYSDNKFNFYSNKVQFTSSQDGRQSAYCNNIQDYLDMVKQYPWQFSNLTHEQVLPTAEQQSRLELLNNLEVQHKNLYENECVLFVEHGAILPDVRSEFLVHLQTEYATLTQSYIDNHIKLKLWEQIKTERDNRTHNGGYPAAGKWFHSDTFSRSQQLGLVMMGANIPAGLMWKTMDGSFIEMTQAVASDVFIGAGIQDSAIFAHAESLKAQVEASTDPASIDIYSGWPICFLDIE